MQASKQMLKVSQVSFQLVLMNKALIPLPLQELRGKLGKYLPPMELLDRLLSAKLATLDEDQKTLKLCALLGALTIPVDTLLSTVHSGGYAVLVETFEVTVCWFQQQDIAVTLEVGASKNELQAEIERLVGVHQTCQDLYAYATTESSENDGYTPQLRDGYKFDGPCLLQLVVKLPPPRFVQGGTEVKIVDEGR
jgi:hypothetical protein